MEVYRGGRARVAVAAGALLSSSARLRNSARRHRWPPASLGDLEEGLGVEAGTLDVLERGNEEAVPVAAGGVAHEALVDTEAAGAVVAEEGAGEVGAEACVARVLQAGTHSDGTAAVSGCQA